MHDRPSHPKQRQTVTEEPSPDAKDTIDTIQPTPDSAAEEYIKQRTLTTGDVVQSRIDHVTTHGDSLVLITTTNQQPLKLTTDLTNTENDSLHQFLQHAFLTTDNEISPSQLKNNTIEILLSDDLDTCEHTTTGCEFDIDDITHQNDLSQYDLDKNFTVELQDFFLTHQYKTSETPHDKDAGCKTLITEVTDPEGRGIQLTARPAMGVELQWEFEIPKTTEMESSPVATLIENQGGGNPEFMDSSGEIVIIHADDVNSGLETIAYTDTDIGEWAFTAPEIHENWTDPQPDTSNNNGLFGNDTSSSQEKPLSNTSTSSTNTSTSTSSSSTSSSSTSSLSPERKKKYNRRRSSAIRGVAFGFLAVTVMSAAFSMVTSMVPAGMPLGPLATIKDAAIAIITLNIIGQFGRFVYYTSQV